MPYILNGQIILYHLLNIASDYISSSLIIGIAVMDITDPGVGKMWKLLRLGGKKGEKLKNAGGRDGYLTDKIWR